MDLPTMMVEEIYIVLWYKVNINYAFCLRHGDTRALNYAAADLKRLVIVDCSYTPCVSEYFSVGIKWIGAHACAVMFLCNQTNKVGKWVHACIVYSFG